ncbi:hypothetical protein [Acidovorax sp. Root217]|uniref:hypothetical protein n=1 Tax=Acidovorax sp. Root217 TaxID=1736492 RepID=UPI0012F889E0|nr:hypothetical protein [Acidovorax sp. Root217]
MSASDLIELHRLKDSCSRLSGFKLGIPTGCYHLSHIYAARGSSERIGLLTPQNLVVCPDWYNRSRRNFDETIEGTGQSIPRSELKSRFSCNTSTTTSELVKKIRNLLGKEFDEFLLRDQFSPGMKAQLLKLASAYERVNDSTPIEDLKQILQKNGIKLYEPDGEPAQLGEVLYLEMKRCGFQHLPSFHYVAAQSLTGVIESKTVASLEPVADQTEKIIFEQILDVLHQMTVPDIANEEQIFDHFVLPRRYMAKRNCEELSSPVDFYCIAHHRFAAPKPRHRSQPSRFDRMHSVRKTSGIRSKVLVPTPRIPPISDLCSQPA